VPPSIIIVNVKPAKELFRRSKRTILANVGGGAVKQVTTCRVNKGTHEVVASHVHATRDMHLKDFVVRTYDVRAVDCD
jgi:hypothetical protein